MGAGMTSFGGFDPYNIFIYNIGSLGWVVWSIREKKYGILIVNIGMLLIYFLGTLKRLL
jgi:hypothetical protein